MSSKNIIIPDGMSAKITGNVIIISEWIPCIGEQCYEIYMHKDGVIHFRGISYKADNIGKLNNKLIVKRFSEANKLCNNIREKFRSI